MAKGNRGGQNSKRISKILYHGSPDTNITQFDDNHMSSNVSSGEKFIYFTDDLQFADDFSYERLETNSMFFNKKGAKGSIYQAKITMNKPLDFTNLSAIDMKNIMKMAKKEGVDEDTINRVLNIGNHRLLKVLIGINNIKDYGYDGYIAKTSVNGNALEYAVASSRQISNVSKYK